MNTEISVWEPEDRSGASESGEVGNGEGRNMKYYRVIMTLKLVLRFIRIGDDKFVAYNKRARYGTANNYDITQSD